MTVAIENTNELDVQPNATGSNASGAVLAVEDLKVAYREGSGWIDVVRGISLEIQQGETYGIVGESGCGKSSTAFAIVDYLGANGMVSGGQVYFQGEDLFAKSGEELRNIRGNRISMVYQNPQSSLNPSMQIGQQIAEIGQIHMGLDRQASWDRAREMLDAVHMPDAEAVLRRYPHQLSGGQQQRVVIAMALYTNPDLLIMDEPTTGLDVTTEAAVLELVNELKHSFNSAILYISHDLSVIASVCDRVGVMYAGQIVESGPVAHIFERPRHPYTLDLLECVPRLDRHYTDSRPLRTIEGRVPGPTELPSGCVFAPRCRFARDECRQARPPLESDGERNDVEHLARCFFSDEVEAVGAEEINAVRKPQEAAIIAPETDAAPLLEMEDLRKYYGRRTKKYLFFGPVQRRVKAVEGITLEMQEGETLSIVGESGSGKTTLGRCVVGLLAPTDGEMNFRGKPLAPTAGERDDETRRAVQIVFQNPEATLNPRHTIGRILNRALKSFGLTDRAARRQRIGELLESVNLDTNYASRYPDQLSGGEKQRIAIARAFTGTPNLVVCDEAVSALDVSVQAAILNLLVELKREEDCGYLFISHDLSVVRYISDRIAVMYLGQLMELGTVDQVFGGPNHPYTEALLSAVRDPDPTTQHTTIELQGTVPSPINPPSGCPFHTRCPRKLGAICETEAPPWRKPEDGHGIYCHIELDELAAMQKETRPEALTQAA
ncbi:MAG: ABC transporter ATP-binding protein [Litorilinea sp.]